MPIESNLAKILIRRKRTLATAESCTGGLLANRITNIPGSSKFFKLGIITYSNEAKIKILGISSRVLQSHGAVSEQVATAMALNVRKIARADFGIGITGIAGPSGGSKHKPVGLVFIAVCTPDEVFCVQCRFKGNRLRIKSQAATEALKLLFNSLS